jgi:hypothetical protein
MAAVSLLLLCASATAQERPLVPTPGASAGAAPSRSLRIPRVTRAPRLNQFLEGIPREAEIVISDFVQREPLDGKPITEQTTAYLSYDDRNVYVVFVCKDESGKVRANMAKREDIWSDDTVAVYFDTFRDRQRAYEFAVNPFGIQADSILTDGQKGDPRFDTVWHSEGHLTDDGYIALIAVPFKSLRFKPIPGQTWGVALGRTIRRRSEHAYWPHITRKQQGFVRQMATMEGLQEISRGRNIQLIPYTSAAAARTLTEPSPTYRNRTDVRGGLDSKIVLRDALTLDVTINPDFSQVESDDPQVTINQRFEVYFPEKRPFFLENAGYFSTPINLFFSRRIIAPEFGGRLSGKIGRWAIGALAADDRAAGARLSPSDPAFGRRAINGVFRLQREFGEQNTFGVLATTRDFGNSWNRVVSFDTRLKLSPTWYFTAQMARSFDHTRNGKGRQGPAYTAQLLRAGRRLTYAGSYTDLSPDFTAPLGFVQRVNMRMVSQYAGYFWQPENSKVINVGPSVSAFANWDRTGRLTDWSANADINVDFKGPTGFRVSKYQAYEWYLYEGFHTVKNSLSFYSNRIKWISLYGTISRGTGVNYSPSWFRNAYVGASSDTSFGFSMRPNPRLKVDTFYYYNRLSTTAQSRLADVPSRTSVYNSHLFRSKVNYQFTRALSFRGILDYYAVLPNTDLISQVNYKQLTGDVLLTYMVNPGTALYIGYNNRFENLMRDSMLSHVMRQSIPPSLMTARQVFVKLSYLFRM